MIELDDVTFHQCVNLMRYNTENTVSFVRPDLSSWKSVLPRIKEVGRTRMEFNVKVKSMVGVKIIALGVVVKVPVLNQLPSIPFPGRIAKGGNNTECIYI